MRRIALFLMALALAGCAASGLLSSGAARRLYISFYAADRGVIYFIKALPVAGENASGDVDFTFNHAGQIADSARINFSLTTPALVRQVDSLTMANGRTSVTVVNPALLFTERPKQGFLSRFAGSAPAGMLPSLFQQPEWRITVYHPGGQIELMSPSKTQRKIRSLDHYLFSTL